MEKVGVKSTNTGTVAGTDFLSALGREGRSITLRMQRYSPWGAMMEAEERRKARDQKAERLFLKQALVVAVIVFLYIIGRQLF